MGRQRAKYDFICAHCCLLTGNTGSHTIPKCYGAVQPTAIYVPLQQAASREYFDLVTTEVFGPFQVIKLALPSMSADVGAGRD